MAFVATHGLRIQHKPMEQQTERLIVKVLNVTSLGCVTRKQCWPRVSAHMAEADVFDDQRGEERQKNDDEQV
jgi:hypothetical protein